MGSLPFTVDFPPSKGYSRCMKIGMNCAGTGEPVKKHPNWGLHRICPKCQEKSVFSCRCLLSDQICSNGHHWFVCFVHGKTVLHESSHKVGIDVCQCDETAFYRS
jgi:hypothetical protein